jgi:hypothetical protein
MCHVRTCASWKNVGSQYGLIGRILAPADHTRRLWVHVLPCRVLTLSSLGTLRMFVHSFVARHETEVHNRPQRLRGKASMLLTLLYLHTIMCLRFASRCRSTIESRVSSKDRTTLLPTVRVLNVGRVSLDSHEAYSASTVIPDYTRMLWYVRAPSFAQLEKFRERVLNCFKYRLSCQLFMEYANLWVCV